MSAGVLVVGGGQAGIELVSSLRERGWQGAITLVGEEAYSPYQRPPLSKAYLAGKADAQSLALRSDEFFERENVLVKKSERIVEVKAPAPNGSTPGRALTNSGETIEFDHLVLAVGAAPRKISAPGSDLRGIHYLRDIADAQALKDSFETAQKVVVVGGGFIGLEAAAVARARGKDVTVLETGDRLIRRVVAPVVSDFYLKAHQRRGTTVRFGALVTGFGGDGGAVRSVELSDGTSIPADLVVVGIGVAPRLELANQLGLECENGGICVDAFAQTSHPGVLAIGDCTVTPHPMAPGRNIRLESVPHAIEQAKTAAATIAGEREPYTAVPWFWSDQDTLKLQIAGLSQGFDQTVVRGDPEAEKFAVYYFRSGNFIAVDAINSPRDFMAGRRALTAGKNITPAELV